MDEKQLVVRYGSPEEDGRVKVGEIVNDLVDTGIQRLVDDDAETAFCLLVVDEKDDRPSRSGSRSLKARKSRCYLVSAPTNCPV